MWRSLHARRGWQPRGAPPEEAAAAGLLDAGMLVHLRQDGMPGEAAPEEVVAAGWSSCPSSSMLPALGTTSFTRSPSTSTRFVPLVAACAFAYTPRCSSQGSRSFVGEGDAQAAQRCQPLAPPPDVLTLALHQVCSLGGCLCLNLHPQTHTLGLQITRGRE